MPELLHPICNLEKFAIIFNPASGAVPGVDRRSTLEAMVKKAGLTCDLAETDRDHGATPLAEKAVKDGVERMLVAGGDGSVAEAADVAVGTPIELAVLPSGTGNLLALNLDIPSDGEEALKLALTAKAERFDVGRANGKVFLIMAGIGLDARVIRDADRKLKQRFGVLAYFIAAFRNIGKRSVRYTITIDGRVLPTRAQTVMVANLGKITGGLELVPGTDPHDGLLDVAILRARKLRSLAVLALKTLVGQRPGDHLLEVRRGQHIVIETLLPQPVQVDGNEAGTATRLDVNVEPNALSLVCPACEEEPTHPIVQALVTGGRPSHWIALTAGVGAAATCCGGAWVARRSGRSPSGFVTQPMLTGAAVAALVYGAVTLWRLRSRESGKTDGRQPIPGRSQTALE